MKKTTKYLIIVLCISLITFSALIYLYSNSPVLGYSEIATDYKIQDRVGLNLDVDALHLGGMPPGGGAERIIAVSFDQDANVAIRITGNATRYLTVDRNNFFLPKNTPVNVSFKVDVPLNATRGEYNGTVEFIFFRPFPLLGGSR